jgi:hypothetical protein
MSRELLQQALDALKHHRQQTTYQFGETNAAIKALEAELSNPEQWGDSAISDPVFLNAQRDINGAIRQLVQTEQEPIKELNATPTAQMGKE